MQLQVRTPPYANETELLWMEEDNQFLFVVGLGDLSPKVAGKYHAFLAESCRYDARDIGPHI